MVNLTISPKQKSILKVLDDKIHTEIFMGGAAGGSKSFTGCLWQVMRRLKYPGSRGFLARARLKSLKESTLLTFFEVCKMLNLKLDVDYNYNAMSGVVKFSNGSEEYLKDLFLYPSDPEFVSLGSTEFTDGFIDEMGEITEQAYQIMRSRIRFKLDEFGLIPKMAMGSNPCKTFVYREFYKKYSSGSLEPYKAYLPASVYDNPFISEHYIENLKKLDPINKARLLDGNWEYDDNPAKLFEYDRILDMFSNNYILPTKHQNYISCDVARAGRDLTVIIVWSGWYMRKIVTMDKSTLDETKIIIEDLARFYKIPFSNIVIDEDGVGGGLVDFMKNVKGFVNNSSPVETQFTKQLHNYRNLKAQCYFLLAKKVNDAQIGCYQEIPIHFKNMIIEDLEQIAQKDIDKSEQKLQIINKEEIKENLGRSPDFSDAIMMRGYFDLKSSYKPHIA